MRALPEASAVGQALRDADTTVAPPPSRTVPRVSSATRSASSRLRTGSSHVQVDARRSARGSLLSTWSTRAMPGSGGAPLPRKCCRDRRADVRAFSSSKDRPRGERAALARRNPDCIVMSRRGRRRRQAAQAMSLSSAGPVRPSSSLPGRRRNCAGRSSPPDGAEDAPSRGAVPGVAAEPEALAACRQLASCGGPALDALARLLVSRTLA